MWNIRVHPTNVKLRVARAGHYHVITGDHYKEGVLGVFMGDGAVIPDDLAEEMWLLGRLGGKKKNIVKKRMRDGVLTEGLFYGQVWRDNDNVTRTATRWNPDWVEGQDVSAELGIR